MNTQKREDKRPFKVHDRVYFLTKKQVEKEVGPDAIDQVWDDLK